MQGYHRKYRTILGLLFIIIQIVLFLNFDSIENIESHIESQFILSLLAYTFMFGLGPFMSIKTMNHYGWDIDFVMVTILAVSCLPVVLLHLGFFAIETKNYIWPLLIGLGMWPFAGFFWVAMGG